jgi:hypothetical protein
MHISAATLSSQYVGNINKINKWQDKRDQREIVIDDRRKGTEQNWQPSISTQSYMQEQ